MPSSTDRHIDGQHIDDVRGQHVSPIAGWPLPILARWDRQGARGLLADLSTAGALTRQAAFVAAACLDPNDPSTFLSHLNINESGAVGIGLALRSRRARDIIAAVFDVPPATVPTGYLRALARIEEASIPKPGLDPFGEPESYRTLFRIMAAERYGQKANALRYCGKLRSSTIQAVETLDPLLVRPEMLAMIGTAKQVRAVNALLVHLRGAVASKDDEGLVAAIQQSLGPKIILEDFARRMVERFDRLPEPPIPAQEGLRPLVSAAEYRAFGQQMKNCAGDKVAEAALGMIAVYAVTCNVKDSSEVIVAATLTPMIDGQWEVADLKLRKNKTPPESIRREVLQRFIAAGALVTGPALSGPYQRDLGELLGAYRWAPLDECLRGCEQLEADPLEELEAAVEEHAR